MSYETLIATQETRWLRGTAGHKVKDSHLTPHQTPYNQQGILMDF